MDDELCLHVYEPVILFCSVLNVRNTIAQFRVTFLRQVIMQPLCIFQKREKRTDSVDIHNTGLNVFLIAYKLS